ncbi:MAG: peptidylprolyl isomerase [Candidatus Eisenbacteria bacterium]|nr:peptidylprolyl isomerase [Candidatus Eisenbacteria bacterium]
MTVADGMKVSLEYTLRDGEGQVLDSNEGGDPLVYTQGSKQLIPAVEQAVSGMSVGESCEIDVAPEDGYGAVNPDAFQQIPIDKIPEGARSVGTQLQTQTPDGHVLHPIVSEVHDEHVVLDFNHPLAGKALHFSLKVLGAEAQEAE